MLDPRAEPNRPRHTRVWVWAIVIAVMLGAGYWVLNKNAKRTSSFRGGTSGAVPVLIAPATIGRINYSLSAIGTVTAFNTVTVNSQVSGQLKKINFTEGQKVQQGDLLAQIDPRTFQVALEQAQGQQKQNAALLQNARRDLQRYQTLYKQDSIAKQQVDTQAALVQQYMGSEKSDQAAVDSAALQLSFTRITAPISGRLGLRAVDQGNLVSASSATGLVVITQTQPISVIFTLPQVQLPAVLAAMHKGQKLVVDLYGRDDQLKIASGELMSVDNQIDVTTGTLKLKARFANDDDALFPNQFVNVSLRVSSNDQALVVPTGAVQQGSIGAFVYVLKADSTVHIQPITTGTIDGKQVAVTAGLTAGQQVVTEGVDRLREGAKVEVMKADASAKSAAASAAKLPAAPATTPTPRARH
ncbi:MAG: MdtA/MuxA family multidrug efflux RND transporter periplasmic adaptor subunit [Paralcaligenes sp.]